MDDAVFTWAAHFSVATVLLFLPMLRTFAGLLTAWMPLTSSAADPAKPVYIGLAEHEAPTIALAGAARRPPCSSPRTEPPPVCWLRRRKPSVSSKPVRPISSSVSVLLLDLLHELKRINAHLVSAAAYPVLEAEGALLPTRLRDEASVA